MNILGLSVFCDASAAVVSDGKLVCAVEEERLQRIKHYDGMPWLAVKECLALADMTVEDVDTIAVGWHPFLGWGTRIRESLMSLLRNPRALPVKASRGGKYFSTCKQLCRLRPAFATRIAGNVKARVVFVDHHLAHAAAAFLLSGYETADVLVADGVGESATLSAYSCSGRAILRTWQLHYPHSLGHLYAAVTGFLGFCMTADEGKVMALAAFGNDRFRDVFSRVAHLDPEKRRFRLDSSILDYHAARKGIYGRRWCDLTGMVPRKATTAITRDHEDLACSLQTFTEKTVLALLRSLFSNDSRKPLCAAGGLFLNSVMNGRITRECRPSFFVPPAAGDNGVSAGAALYVSALQDPAFQLRRHVNVYLGRQFSDPEIDSVLRQRSLFLEPTHDVHAETARLIADGKVVAWYRGRMEYGPRALGNRSILASAISPHMKDTVNRKVKHRESFRPFGAAVLLEDAPRYFIDVSEAPYMLKVFEFRRDCLGTFPAITHVDGTCRIQTVTPQHNEDLYRLLLELKRRTGHGIVLNTSLNVAGEPIINTPSEALDLLAKTGVEVLVLGPYLVYKENVTRGNTYGYFGHSAGTDGRTAHPCRLTDHWPRRFAIERLPSNETR